MKNTLLYAALAAVFSGTVLPCPALAASAGKDSPVGRYALDGAACKAKDYFVTLTDDAVTLPTLGCKGVSYDQTENKGGRAVYAVTARSCLGEEPGQPRKESFTLVLDAAGLQILWADGAKSAVFMRCGKL
ncbi:hypothetical protein [Methylocystis iwaonis]|uniref:hypothetical protein n=1 Tax=Methylocystis iwaonis TaxID=2885079 RepID=UPI002E7B9037|nr:hypothetical protein [Methylocystis iwaonis]